MTKIGLLGTGLMGSTMVQRLIGKNYEVIAYNRSPEKLDSLEVLGVKVTTFVKDVLKYCPVIILILSDKKAIEDVLLNDNQCSLIKGRMFLQMGTISPEDSIAISQIIEQHEGYYLECPVLGSLPQIKTGTLQVMVGGEKHFFEQYQAILQVFDPSPRYIGKVGTASALKLALNQLIASLTTAFSLSLHFIQKQGVEVSQFMEILRDSALYAPTFDKKLNAMLTGTFSNPNFPTKHLLKDTNLFLAQADSLGLNTSALLGVKAIILKAIELGLAEQDYSSIHSVIDDQLIL